MPHVHLFNWEAIPTGSRSESEILGWDLVETDPTMVPSGVRSHVISDFRIGCGPSWDRISIFLDHLLWEVWGVEGVRRAPAAVYVQPGFSLTLSLESSTECAKSV